MLLFLLLNGDILVNLWVVMTQLLCYRDLCAYFFSATNNADRICCGEFLRHTFFFFRLSALVTLSTRIARLPFLKYLRFSREIDWNNFSHTDSSPAAFKRDQPKQKDGGDFSSACQCLVFLSLCGSCGPFGNLRLRCRVPLGETNFRYF